MRGETLSDVTSCPVVVGVTIADGEERRRHGEEKRRERRGGEVAVTTRKRFRVAPSRSACRL